MTFIPRKSAGSSFTMMAEFKIHKQTDGNGNRHDQGQTQQHDKSNYEKLASVMDQLISREATST